MRPLGSGRRSGARRSRCLRVPASSHRSGSSREGRLVRPRQAAEDRRVQVRFEAGDAEAPPQSFGRVPQAAALEGFRQQARGGFGIRRHRPLAQEQPVVPVLGEGPDRSRGLVEAVRDLRPHALEPLALHPARGPDDRLRGGPGHPARHLERDEQVPSSHPALPPEQGAHARAEDEPGRAGLPPSRHAIGKAGEQGPEQPFVLSFRGTSTRRVPRNPQSRRRRGCGSLVARFERRSSG